MRVVPCSFADVTPEWLTAALRSSGCLNEQTVVAREITPIGEDAGFASRMGRITLTVDTPVSRLPSTMILKMAAENDDAARAEMLRDKYMREARFYSTIWPHVGVRTPICYFVAHQAEPPRIVLLLEDFAAARFGDAAVGWSLQESEQVVDALAALHATWWNDSRIEDWEWLTSVGESSSQLEKLEDRRGAFLDRYGDAVSPKLRRLTERLDRTHQELLARLGGPPTTLLHVDTHLDNIAFVGEGENAEAVLFDWQGVGRGLGVFDLALFLSGGSAEQQGRYEQELVCRYHRRLAESGMSGYSLEELTADYRVALLRWWIGTVNGLGSTYASIWTGRQAEMARQSVLNWNALNANHELNRLLEPV